jgi:hypothetical protein
VSLFLAGFFTVIWTTLGPRWRCTKCNHAWE